MSEKNSKRYVQEYKKYLMCAMASKIAVTPSEQTDLVWHTHICTNDLYPLQMAKIMFKKRLGRFDHGPTKGGDAQGILFTEQYTRTLEICEYLFGPAPKDIWETLDKRFLPELFCMYHVDLRRVCNYRIAVEMARDRVDKSKLSLEDDEMYIVRLNPDSKNHFFNQESKV